MNQITTALSTIRCDIESDAPTDTVRIPTEIHFEQDGVTVRLGAQLSYDFVVNGKTVRVIVRNVDARGKPTATVTALYHFGRAEVQP